MKLKNLIEWSKKEFSHLPWRNNRSLYTTLVSEIMLQQTTVGTVKNHFDRFLSIYPDIQTLAQSTEEELLIAWKGLGYYRRAKNLKKIADIIIGEHQGKFPRNKDELLQIPGIGPYTSSALISIGMDLPSLAVDANIERVVARLYGLNIEKGPKLQKEILRLFEEGKILNFKNISYRELNEALMDLGRTFCQARRTSCELCPLSSDCVALKKKAPLMFPIDKTVKSKSMEHELHLLRCFVFKKDKILVYKKNEKQWLAGQYEVPTFIISSTDKKLTQYPELRDKVELKDLKKLKTGITKYHIYNYIYSLSYSEFKNFSFKNDVEWKSSLDNNFSVTTQKCLKKIKPTLDLKNV